MLLLSFKKFKFKFACFITGFEIDRIFKNLSYSSSFSTSSFMREIEKFLMFLMFIDEFNEFSYMISVISKEILFFGLMLSSDVFLILALSIDVFFILVDSADK